MGTEALGYIFAGLVGLVVGVIVAIVALAYMDPDDWED